MARYASPALELVQAYADGLGELDEAIAGEVRQEAEEGMLLDSVAFLQASAALAADEDADDDEAETAAGGGTDASVGRVLHATDMAMAAGMSGALPRRVAERCAAVSPASPAWSMASPAGRSVASERQHAIRSGRRAGNDALSSLVQNSVRRGPTSRTYQAMAEDGPESDEEA